MKLAARMILLLLLAIPAFPPFLRAAEEESLILNAPPETPDPARRHVFYLHGAILEAGDRRPSTERFGVYQYDETLERLAGPGHVVISEHRPRGTRVREYAARVVEQIRGLIQAGVAPGCITVVGFSKGGAIAVTTSALLADDRVRFVFLAPCGPYLDHQGLDVSGRILSIYEQSDESAGSCGAVFDHAAALPEVRELMISTDRGHGAFWQPRDAWMQPVLDWIAPGGESACHPTAP